MIVMEFILVSIAWLHDSYIESFYMQAAYSTACVSLKPRALGNSWCYLL